MSQPYSRVILAANPAHPTEAEHGFWCAVAAAARSRGWLLLELAARRIPPTPNSRTVIIPARLWELATKMRRLDRRGLEPDLPWLDEGWLRLLDEWEHLRWELPTHDARVRAGLLRLAHYVDTAIATVRPAVVLTTNKIDHGVAFPRLAALHYGAQTLVVERSPFDGIWLEPEGIFGESRIWSEYRAAQHALGAAEDEAGERVVAGMVGNPYGFRRAEARRDSPVAALAGASRPLVFLPMDNVLWTGWQQREHPLRTIEYPLYESPHRAIEHLHQQVGRLGGTLVVKNHPSCKHIGPYSLPEGVVYSAHDLAALIEAADVVVCFNTKVAFVAMAMGKPVLTLAMNPVAASGATYHCLEESGVLDTLRLALEQGFGPERRQQLVRYCGWLARHYFYDCSDGGAAAGGRGPEAFVSTLIDRATAALGPELDPPPESALANLKLLAAGHRKGVYRLGDAPAPPTSPAPEGEAGLRLVFDANRLAEEHTHHSGISRYARELLRRLAADDTIEVDAVITRMGRATAALRQAVADRIRRETGVIPQFVAPDAPLPGLDAAAGRAIYHTPIGPLPARSTTGEAVRVLTVHDCLHVKFPELYPRPGEKPAIERTLESLDPARDFVMCDSEATRRDLLSLVPIDEERVVVVPLAAETTYFHPDAELAARQCAAHGLEPGRYFVALCQADPRKNVETVVKSLAELERQNALDGFRAALVTRSSASADLLRTLQEARVPRARVAVLEDLDDAHMAALYSRAAFSVYVPWYEGFGLPPLESMAAGCPAIVSSTSSLPEVVGEAGIYVDPGDRATVVRAVRTAIATPSLLDSLRPRAHAQAARFSWERTAREALDLYRRALEASQPHAVRKATIRGSAPPAATPDSRPRRLARQLKALAPQLAAWYRTPSGLAFCVWLALAGYGVSRAPGALWAAGAALAGAALLGPYFSMRAKRDAEERDRGTRGTLRSEFRQAEKLAQSRWSELLAEEREQRQRNARALVGRQDRLEASLRDEIAGIDPWADSEWASSQDFAAALRREMQSAIAHRLAANDPLAGSGWESAGAFAAALRAKLAAAIEQIDRTTADREASARSALDPLQETIDGLRLDVRRGGRRQRSPLRRVGSLDDEMHQKGEELLAERRSRPKPAASASGDREEAGILAPTPEFDRLYVAFEDRFRGSQELVRQRLAEYLPRVRGVVAEVGGGVMDLGCGRGEWLELLGHEGIAARGVDANEEMARACRQRGLDVEVGDVLTTLRAVEPASHAVLTAFHVVEHLGFETLDALLSECHRVLAPGGLLLIETPNPENVTVGSFSFWRDPTHRHPLPPDVLSFLVEQHGLASVEIKRLYVGRPVARPIEVKRLPAQVAEALAPLLRVYQQSYRAARDYCVVARRPG